MQREDTEGPTMPCSIMVSVNTLQQAASLMDSRNESSTARVLRRLVADDRCCSRSVRRAWPETGRNVRYAGNLAHWRSISVDTWAGHTGEHSVVLVTGCPAVAAGLLCHAMGHAD